jgi:rRNA maturation RNase YbeY
MKGGNKAEVFTDVRAFKNLVPRIKAAAEQLLELMSERNARVDIFLVDDAIMNKNVLSFQSPSGFPNPDFSEKPLGEIYLNPRYIERNREDLFFMLTHGFLHLLNYDHERSGDRIAMEKKEKELRTRLRI